MDEELFLRIIKDAFLNIPNVVYDKTRFLYYIRNYKSYEIRKFNSVETIAHSINDKELDGISLFDKLSILENIKFDELMDVFKFFTEVAMSSYIVKKQDK